MMTRVEEVATQGRKGRRIRNAKTIKLSTTHVFMDRGRSHNWGDGFLSLTLALKEAQPWPRDVNIPRRHEEDWVLGVRMTREQTKLVKSDMSRGLRLLTRNQRDKNNISIRFAGLLFVGGNRDGVFTIKCWKASLIPSEFHCERRKGLTVISEAVA